jgi:hypothetical protein
MAESASIEIPEATITNTMIRLVTTDMAILSDQSLPLSMRFKQDHCRQPIASASLRLLHNSAIANNGGFDAAAQYRYNALAISSRMISFEPPKMRCTRASA